MHIQKKQGLSVGNKYVLLEGISISLNYGDSGSWISTRK